MIFSLRPSQVFNFNLSFAVFFFIISFCCLLFLIVQNPKSFPSLLVVFILRVLLCWGNYISGAVWTWIFQRPDHGTKHKCLSTLLSWVVLSLFQHDRRWLTLPRRWIKIPHFKKKKLGLNFVNDFVGFFCPPGSSNQTELCPRGYYCPLGVDSPRECPPGTWSDRLGLNDSSLCYPCWGKVLL